MISPISGDLLNLSARKLNSRRIHQFDGERMLKPFAARSQFERITFTFRNVHAPIAFVLELRRALHLQAKAMPIQWIEWGRRINCHLPLPAAQSEMAIDASRPLNPLNRHCLRLK